VCRRWRSVVFAYPRHLDLHIVSRYNKRVRNAPKFWPVLPVIIWYPYHPTFHPILTSDEDNIFDILKNPARICEINLYLTRPLFAKFALSLKKLFPALNHLRLRSQDTIALPIDFLGGSAPRLRVLHLTGLGIPMLPWFLSLSKNLVSLRLEDINRGRYFPVEDLAMGLSTATRLEFLELSFPPGATTSPLSQILGGPSPSSSPIVLPSLTEFRYVGRSAYLRCLVSRIDTPIIEKISVSFDDDSEYDNNYELCELFGLGDVLRSSRCRATHVRLSAEFIVFSHHLARIPSSPGLFRLKLPYRTRRPIPPLVAQVCLGLESQAVLPKVIHLGLEDFPSHLIRNNYHLDPLYWLDLLRTLTGLKTLHIAGKLAPIITFALAQITGETIPEILPALQELDFGFDAPSWTLSFIEKFIAERQLCGIPVSVHFRYLNWD
jgi:hypothetical protein